MKPWVIWIGILAVGLWGCRKEQPDTYDKATLLQAVVDGQLLPQLADFTHAVDSLEALTAVFVQQPDTVRLGALRAHWVETDLHWKACELYDFGLAMDRHIHSRIGKWPTDTNIIQTKLTSRDSMDAAFFESLGATSRGLPAMEYLLFDENAAATVWRYSADSFATARRAYVQGLVTNLAVKAGELYQLWAPQGENYGEVWAHSTASGTQDPMGLLVNAMISLLEEVAKSKIGKPMGKYDFGFLQPEAVESYRANVSLALLRANLVALQQVYLGGPTTGIDVALDQMDAQYGESPLSEEIALRFVAVIAAADAITIPLQDACVTQSTQVEALFEACKALVRLFKADLASALSVTVTVSDNDGD